MARRKTLIEYLESLPEDCVAVRIRVGDNGNPPTTAVVALPEYKGKDTGFAPLRVENREELIQAVAGQVGEDGWPEECSVVRLHPYTATGGQLPTFSRTAGPRPGAPGGTSPEWGIIGRLVDGYLAFGGEMRRTVDILTETLAHRESMANEALESALAARQDAQDAEMQAYAAQLAADELSQVDQPGPFDGAAGDILGQILGNMGGGTPQGEPATAADRLRSMLDDDPSLVNELINDSDLMTRFASAYEATQTNHAGDPEAEPAPAPDA